MSRWYRLEGKIPVPATENQFEEIFDEVTRRVGYAELPNGGSVSTVFLGLDHSHGGDKPVLFESMYFPNADGMQEDDCERYHTWKEAEEGHRRMVIKYGGTETVLDEGLFTI
jgi:hypothetical protein